MTTNTHDGKIDTRVVEKMRVASGYHEDVLPVHVFFTELVLRRRYRDKVLRLGLGLPTPTHEWGRGITWKAVGVISPAAVLTLAAKESVRWIGPWDQREGAR